MASSTLLPKIQRNHMLPMRCIHPPCRNIDVSTVCQALPPSANTQEAPGLIGMLAPGGALCRRSAGIRPRRQTEEESAGAEPRPCSRTQARTLAAIRPYVAYGGRKWGLA